MDSRPGSVSDEELLTRLAASFSVEQTEPDASSLRQLSLAVAELRRPVVAAPTPQPSRRRASRRHSIPRRLSPVAAAGALVAALAMGSGISYAVGGPAPAVVRSVARSVGLAPPGPPPTTLSPAVNAAQQAESALHQTLTNANSSSAALSRATSNLAHRLAEVGDDHSSAAERVTDDGHHLLVEACQKMDGPGSDGGSGASGTSSTPGGPCASAGDHGTARGQRLGK